MWLRVVEFVKGSMQDFYVRASLRTPEVVAAARTRLSSNGQWREWLLLSSSEGLLHLSLVGSNARSLATAVLSLDQLRSDGRSRRRNVGLLDGVLVVELAGDDAPPTPARVRLRIGADGPATVSLRASGVSKRVCLPATVALYSASTDVDVVHLALDGAELCLPLTTLLESRSSWPLDNGAQISMSVVCLPNDDIPEVACEEASSESPTDVEETMPSRGWIHASCWQVQLHRVAAEGCRLRFRVSTTDCATPPGRACGNQIQWETAREGLLVPATQLIRVDLESHEGKVVGSASIAPVFEPAEVTESLFSGSVRVADLTLRLHAVAARTWLSDLLPLSKGGIVVRVPEARFLQHPACRGRIEPFVECTLDGSHCVRGAISWSGIDTSPRWPNQALRVHVPAELAQILDKAKHAYEAGLASEGVEAARHAALHAVGDAHPPTLSLRVHSSTVAKTLIGEARLEMPWLALLSNECRARWLQVNDANGAQRGEVCVSGYERVELGEEENRGVLVVSIPAVDAPGLRCRGLHVQLNDHQGTIGKLPKQIVLPATTRRGITLNFTDEECGAALVVASLQLDSILESASSVPATRMMRDLDARFDGKSSARLEAVVLPSSRGCLHITLVSVNLSTTALDEAARLTDEQEQHLPRRLFVRAAVSACCGGDHDRTPTSFCGTASWQRESPSQLRLFVDTERHASDPIDAPTLRLDVLDERAVWRNRIATGEIALFPLLGTKHVSSTVALVDPLTHASRGMVEAAIEYFPFEGRAPTPMACAALADLHRAAAESGFLATVTTTSRKNEAVAAALRELCPQLLRRDKSLRLIRQLQQAQVANKDELARVLLATAVLCTNVHSACMLLRPAPAVPRHEYRPLREPTFVLTVRCSAVDYRTLCDTEAQAALKHALDKVAPISRVMVQDGDTAVKCYVSSGSIQKFKTPEFAARVRAALFASFGPCELERVAPCQAKSYPQFRRVKRTRELSGSTEDVTLREATDAEARIHCLESQRACHLRQARQTRRKLRHELQAAKALAAYLCQVKAISRKPHLRPRHVTEAGGEGLFEVEAAQLRVEREALRHAAQGYRQSRDEALAEAAAFRTELEGTKRELADMALQEAPPSWAIAARESAMVEASRYARAEQELRAELGVSRAAVEESRREERRAAAALEEAESASEMHKAQRRDSERRRAAVLAELERRFAKDAAIDARRASLAMRVAAQLEFARDERQRHEELTLHREKAAALIQRAARGWLGRRASKRTRRDQAVVLDALGSFVQRRRVVRRRARAAASMAGLRAVARGRSTRARLRRARQSANVIGRAWRRFVARAENKAQDAAKDATVAAEVAGRARSVIWNHEREKARHRRRVRHDRKAASLQATRVALDDERCQRHATDAAESPVRRRRRGLVLLANVLSRLVLERYAIAIDRWRQTYSVVYTIDEDEVAKRLDDARRVGLAALADTERFCRSIVETVASTAASLGDDAEKNAYHRLASEFASQALDVVLNDDFDEEEVEQSLASTNRHASSWSSPTVYDDARSQHSSAQSVFVETALRDIPTSLYDLVGCAVDVRDEDNEDAWRQGRVTQVDESMWELDGHSGICVDDDEWFAIGSRDWRRR